MSFQGTLGERLGQSRIPRLGWIGSIVGVVGRFRLGYERGFFFGSEICVIDGSSLRLSATLRGSVEDLFGRTETRRSTVGVRSGRATDDLGLAVVGGGAIRRFVREGGCSISRLEGECSVLGVGVAGIWSGGLGEAAMVRGSVPSILLTAYNNLAIFAGGALLLGVIAGGVSYFLAKRSG